jgi:membrane protease subunit (stomatin/prohibitin family)
MSNFKTNGEARRFCEKYGFTVPGNLNAFDLAEAFLKAFNDGNCQAQQKDTRERPSCPKCGKPESVFYCEQCGHTFDV